MNGQRAGVEPVVAIGDRVQRRTLVPVSLTAEFTGSGTGNWRRRGNSGRTDAGPRDADYLRVADHPRAV
jgi:hypothetical protein